MKLALVYDRINSFGGAERVLQSLHHIWPEAPVFTSVYHPQKASWANGWDIRPSSFNNLKITRNHHQAFYWLMPYLFESMDLSDFDVVVSITSAEAKGIITQPHQLHICYMLTPTRYLWSHTHQYQHKFIGNYIPGFSRLRQWDYVAAQRPDFLIPISQHVAKRIRKYYRREPRPVIYPPVNSPKLDCQSTCQFDERSYYLIVSRLVDYKNISTAIKAFSQMPNKHLVVVGQGPSAKKLKRIAPNNCVFTGAINDQQLNDLYNHAKALIFPQEEDFGIVAVEAQMAGKPVIAWNRGAATETVVHNQTGILYSENHPKSLKSAIREFEEKNWYDDQIKAHVQKFNHQLFKLKFKQTVENLWQQHRNQ